MNYSKQLMLRLLPKLDLEALDQTLRELNWQDVRPLFLDMQIDDIIGVDMNMLENNEEFLMNLHDIICKRHITRGVMCCPSCNRQYDITNGIVNMLLTEDEV